jgi:RNA recognition motif. (a.k.a. RRM, RBD, or RNP domain)
VTSGTSSTFGAHGNNASNQFFQQPGGSSAFYQQPSNASPAPQIANPFPLPGQPGSVKEKYDPQLESQIAQWQSAYVARDDFRRPVATDANHVPLGERAIGQIDVGRATAPETGVAAVVSGADGKQKTVVRSGGGKTWQDPSLLEWDPSHPRLFVGNLAGEVTDESLFKAFAKYPTIVKARVIRDKRTTKSKGFGFVSFVNSDDYFQAAREMQGKYIGSHPVLIKRSTTEIKAVNPNLPQKKKGHGGGGGHGHGGIQKKQPKKKGGIKFLG